MNITNEQLDAIVSMYEECTTEDERADTVLAIGQEYVVTLMQVRQWLQDEGVYNKPFPKELSQKEQYSNALSAVTEIPAKEFMKLSIKANKALFEVFKNAHH